jgi:nucleoside-diphosphate kinase
MDRTLIILKPHAVQRGLTGRILSRFEDMGLTIRNIKHFQGSARLWQRFYPSDETWFKNAGLKTLKSCQDAGIDVKAELGTSDPSAIGRMIKEWLVGHMSSGPCVAVILEGNEAPIKVRKACGPTLPNLGQPGNIRFDFSCDSPALANKEKRPVFNLIHASDPEEEGSVEKEILIIFGENPDFPIDSAV